MTTAARGPASASGAEPGASATGSRLGTLFVVLAPVLVFAATLGFPFLTWDDTDNVSQNPLVRGTADGTFARIWSEPYAGLYVPLSYSAWRVLALVSGSPGTNGVLDPQPSWFHAANLALHVVCALVVLRLLRRLLAHEGAAVCGALLFALHPLQVEPVAWVSELRGLLAAALGLVALERWWTRDEAHTRAAWLARAGLALALFVAALLAKPSAVVFPALLLLLEVLGSARPWRETFPRMLPAVAVGGALAVVAVALASSAQSEKLGETVALAQRPRVALDALGFYLEKLCVPLSLAPDYGRTPQRVLDGGTPVWVLALAPGALVALVVSRARRLAWLAAAIFLAALLPVLGLVPFAFQKLSTVADRYAYVALIGPAILLGLLVRARANLGASIAGCVLALCALLSWKQASIWSSSRALFEHTLTVNDGSFKAWSHIALSYGYENKDAEAIAAYERCLELEPDHQVAHYNLAILLQRNGRHDEAFPHLEAASRLKESDTSAHAAYAVALLGKQRPAEARVLLEKVLAANPNDAAAHYSMASAWLLEQNLEAAAQELERAVALRRDAEYVRTLGVVRGALGDEAAALANARTAVELRPDWIDAVCDLASLLAGAQDERARDPARALDLAQRAVKLGAGRNARALEVLALVHARAGRLADAAAALEQALPLVRAAEPQRAPLVEQTLQAYQRAVVAPR